MDSAGFGESFAGVLAAARQGEEWSWRLLYRELALAVLGYLRARGAPEPEDLAGEVFVQMVRDLPGFEGSERELRSWALTIAHHRMLDERRRRARRPTTGGGEELAEAQLGGDVETEALETFGDRRVREALAALSEDQRSVLLLRIVGDLTVEQVAETIGKSPGAVKALQRRGLARLKDVVAMLTVTI